MKQILISTLTMACLLGVYDYFVIQPKLARLHQPYIAVDFAALSDAKIRQLLTRQQKVSPDELNQFIIDIQSDIQAVAGGRPVFVAGALFSGKQDITKALAKRYGLSLTQTQKGDK